MSMLDKLFKKQPQISANRFLNIKDIQGNIIARWGGTCGRTAFGADRRYCSRIIVAGRSEILVGE